MCVQVQPELSTTEAKDKFPKGVEVYKVPSEREYMRFVRRTPRPPAPWLPRAATARPPLSEHLCIPRLTRAFSPSADTRPKMSSAAARRMGTASQDQDMRACVVLLGATRRSLALWILRAPSAQAAARERSCGGRLAHRPFE